ncbi:uncharacterized protein FOMMEDRAFT_19571 [Fomitiporia mediterranea MF3/22]|uniref:uncharacterized protein n=1 Tax=Fomitiporia mediterranea (strain MF3/22) TaxID=694068 RepID=UPI000440821B|nr:uncharacterized protein FOMMEDRAFT_19571 [Fomitiporia mediterranea MF3/22]EJD04308.1 hypothetical protein FOMMEDRAFT_19571 [Fomitiporia mediterranea MF3/22]
MSKSKSKAEEALQFLDDLDNYSPEASAHGGNAPVADAANPSDPADVLKFIDEITQKSSEPTRTTPAPLERPASRASLATPGGTIRKATERVRVGSPAPSSAGSNASAAPPRADASPRAPTPAKSDAAATDADAGSASKGGWGWGSVWSSASAALQQARSAVDESVKHIPINEQAAKWREEVMNRVPLNKEQLEKLGNDLRTVGYSTLTDILNAVAPPISEHEVIQIWSSHDMEGFEGIESLVYKALARVMEQVEGGDLIVNKGKESNPRESGSKRNMNAVEGLETALRLAEANIEELVKSNPQNEKKPQPSGTVPTTYSSVYLRIQPFLSTLPLPGGKPSSPKSSTEPTHLQFLLYLSDPEHQLTLSTVTQASPAKWLDHWENQDWVEDVTAEILKTGVETIGQEYIVARMGWLKEDAVSVTPEKQEETK